MGFSVKDGKIVAQNRSHHVPSSDSNQFKGLDKWIEVNSSSLYTLLCDQDLNYSDKSKYVNG